MSEAHDWSALTTQQLGRYGEYIAKMEFARLGFDIYSPEVDDKGIDFVLRCGVDAFYDVQVKSLRPTGDEQLCDPSQGSLPSAQVPPARGGSL